jgi:hypothetical protein
MIDAKGKGHMFTQVREEAHLSKSNQQAQWRKPEAGWHRINNDVSYIQETGRAYEETILGDDKGIRSLLSLESSKTRNGGHYSNLGGL